MSTKHTPGPWELLTGTVSSASGDEIAEVVGGDGGRYLDDDVNAQCLANARLIAAAPELLGALSELLDFAIDTNSHLPRKGERMEVVMAFRRNPGEIDVFKKARAAIAKATAE